MFANPNFIGSDSDHVLPVQTSHRAAPHSGVIWIGLFELTKALLALAIGIGAIHMLHRDISDAVLDLAAKLRFDPESHFVSLILDQTAVLGDSSLRAIGLTTFLYSALAMVEAVGLLLQKEWAELLTILISASFLPFEAYEIYNHSTLWKWAIAATNLIILFYLLWVIRENRRET